MSAYPYQRFLDQLCREGRDTEDIIESLEAFGFKPPEPDVVDGLKTDLSGTDDDDLFNSEELSIAIGLLDDDDAVDYVKGSAQSLDDEEIAEVVRRKFGIILTEDSVKAFRDAFWDLESMGQMEAILYFSGSDEIERPRENVPIDQVTRKYAWEDGEEIVLGKEEIYSQLELDAYFKYKKSLDIATPASQAEARKWGEFLMKVIKERTSYNKATSKPHEDVPEKPELLYDDGDSPPPTIDELKQPEG